MQITSKPPLSVKARTGSDELPVVVTTTIMHQPYFIVLIFPIHP